MKRIFSCAVLCLALLAPVAARAALLVGWIAQCTAVTATTCTESSASGYARQPMTLSNLAFGKSVNAMPWSYAATASGTLVGRALYDAATGGNLLVVMPLASALVIPSQGDRGDVGTLSLTVNALVSVFDGTFSQAAIASGATVGVTQDGSTATAGSALTITRGQLYKAGTITW